MFFYLIFFISDRQVPALSETAQGAQAEPMLAQGAQGGTLTAQGAQEDNMTTQGAQGENLSPQGAQGETLTTMGAQGETGAQKRKQEFGGEPSVSNLTSFSHF